MDGQTTIFLVDADGPPAILSADRISNQEAREAAQKIAVDWQLVQPEDGNVDCPLKVLRPTRSGEFAFVGFSDPSGEIGAYVFKGAEERWTFVEKIQLGFW